MIFGVNRHLRPRAFGRRRTGSVSEGCRQARSLPRAPGVRCFSPSASCEAAPRGGGRVAATSRALCWPSTQATERVPLPLSGDELNRRVSEGPVARAANSRHGRSVRKGKAQWSLACSMHRLPASVRALSPVSKSLWPFLMSPFVADLRSRAVIDLEALPRKSQQKLSVIAFLDARMGECLLVGVLPARGARLGGGQQPAAVGPPESVVAALPNVHRGIGPRLCRPIPRSPRCRTGTQSRDSLAFAERARNRAARTIALEHGEGSIPST